MRLGGPKLAISGSLDMLSEAIVRGSVQVPGHGDPIVLLADHQTTGGYPKIATVISADQDGLAQLRPRESLSFRTVTPEQAIAAARIRARQIDGYLAALGG
jgi:allophanate hydrolase